MTFRESIPSGLYDVIEQHLNGVCRESAITSWQRNKYKEDSITGAFFQGISKSVQSFGNSWQWGIDYNSFSSHTEEPHLGADGIFQIDVKDEYSRSIFRKGFLFQSKKQYNVEKAKTYEQLDNIERHVPHGGLLIIYDEAGYRAVTGRAYLRNSRNWKQEEYNFCAFLVQQFLTCRFGIQGLYYDFNKEEIINNEQSVRISPKSVTTVNIKKIDK